AELAAFAADRDPARLVAAELALAWYYGKNSLGVAIASGGGCYDGLEATGVNRNMGAESTLAHLAGAYALAEHRQSVLRAVR
ncbi:MAG: glycosyltransferase, partial [Candidatus Eremiobacteraeota bacterium]|nr:glycosyltransferase [Candidatus Eremiobacteraeota bacterium]